MKRPNNGLLGVALEKGSVCALPGGTRRRGESTFAISYVNPGAHFSPAVHFSPFAGPIPQRRRVLAKETGYFYFYCCFLL